MLNETYIWLRLLACLFVSTSLHAGTMALEWGLGETPVLAGTRQIEVALVALPEQPAEARTSAVEGKYDPLVAEAPTEPSVAKAPAPAPRPDTASVRTGHAETRRAHTTERGSLPAREPVLTSSSPRPESREDIQRPPQDPSPSVADITGSGGTPDRNSDHLETADVRLVEPPGKATEVAPEAPDLQSRAEPLYRSNPLPEYPLQARRRHWEGAVWLRVNVSPHGTVTALEVEESSGHRVLDRAAQQSVRRWKFRPARRNGLPVACEVRIPVNFRLERG